MGLQGKVWVAVDIHAPVGRDIVGVLVRHADGAVEVSAVDPVASMQAIENPSLAELAKEVQAKLKKVVGGL